MNQHRNLYHTSLTMNGNKFRFNDNNSPWNWSIFSGTYSMCLYLKCCVITFFERSQKFWDMFLLCYCIFVNYNVFQIWNKSNCETSVLHSFTPLNENFKYFQKNTFLKICQRFYKTFQVNAILDWSNIWFQLFWLIISSNVLHIAIKL